MTIVKGPDNDKEAVIRHLIAEHQSALTRLCYLYLHDVQLAEDAVQETFLKAYRTLERFRGDANAKTWLTRIAMRTCCDMRRTFWFRRVDRRVTLESLPDSAAEADEDDSALTLAVMNLPIREREAVLLYYYQDMNVREIAKALGVTQPTVSYRLRRARERLREELEGREEP